jgi:cobyrinic acid a,c-diamide synthase
VKAEQVSHLRLVIAAPQGRSGKTTVALGLCAALKGRGLAVQPFKKGPDYIDPSWLSAAAGRPCRSLDPFFIPDAVDLQKAFTKGARGAEFSLIEGNHGLFDSSLPEEGEDRGRGSTAAVARTLQAPILLVINAARMTRSAAAMVHGYQTFEPGTPIAGVILNNVAHGRHEAKLRGAIEEACRIPVLGALPRDEALSIPDRHLGLVPQGEGREAQSALEACRRAVERWFDLDGLLEIAASAPPIKIEASQKSHHPAPFPGPTAKERVRIGVFRDRAFSFYYPENFEALEEAGGSLVWIDAFEDSALPGVDALFIGGGFPEVFMAELSANLPLRREVRQSVEAGLPVYAECGGLMYLAQSLHWDGRLAEMVGVFPHRIEMSPRPQGHGYVLAEIAGPNPFFPVGTVIRGHEFHHSRLVPPQLPFQAAYRLARGKGTGSGQDGLVYKNVLAAYTHLHAAGAQGWAEGLVARGREYAGLYAGS